ncbi:MAG TPA: hypothetical protein VF665_24205 [Longimicrobium sp.]|jgi:hypothetical protein|uniref:hypothetical protein n=1 Tax=Longimicrobium sp. TaxID=2029185 RepID=UPI002ED97E18
MILESAVAALLCTLPATAAGYAGYFSWRGRKRNRAELCATCAGPQYAAPAYEAPSLVQGRLTCAPCAARHRTRVRVALGAAGALSTAAVAGTATVAVIGGGGLLLPVAVTLEYAGIFGGAVVWMKRRNRAAHRELQAGIDPLFRLPESTEPHALPGR